MGDVTLHDSMLADGLNDAFSGQHSGWHTEDLAARQGITREEQDRWALRSQQRFAAAQAAGHFEAEIATVEVPGRKGSTPFRKDEHNRPDTSAESLARLTPAFRSDGSITAGSAPGLNTGPGARRVVDHTGRAGRDQRGLCCDHPGLPARAGFQRRGGQCGRRRHRPWSPDWRHRRGADHAPAACDAA
jgi:acetyl-CoA acetyltransferase